MIKIISAVVGGLMLSGCALPVPIQIASWALDGISLLATDKSITDHGISALAQQDCALWRGVTEGSVCREDDPIAIIADQGDVTGNVEKTGSGASLTTSFRRILSPSRNEPLPPTPATQASWVMEPETVTASVVDTPENKTVADVVPETVTETVTETAQVEKDQAPQLHMVPQEFAYNAAPGNYFVIGSFGVQDNAEKFAARYPVLDAQIMAANVADKAVYRIVVGPYNAANKTFMRLLIRNVGISDTWAVRVSADGITLAWRPSGSVTEIASLPAVE